MTSGSLCFLDAFRLSDDIFKSLFKAEITINETGNQKMHSLGWNEVTVDYHSMQIAIACLEADTK